MPALETVRAERLRGVGMRIDAKEYMLEKWRKRSPKNQKELAGGT